jgi:ABC-2 type transport system ATP-binding protein
MPSPAIETHRLGKRFGDRVAVHDVDLEVPQGVAFGFLGPNGAGKTTLIKMLLGLARPTSGGVRVLGSALPEGRAAALARVGAVVEEPRFHAHLSGRENLWTFAAARDRVAEARIGGALERVGLAARADDRVGDYSLGMKQRLGIARCLIADPALLILDEPMNGLDPGGMQELRDLIRSLVGEGRTVFLSSHLLDEVERVCDAAAVVDRGRVVASGPIAELLRGGARTIAVGTDNPVRASAALAPLPGVRAVTADATEVRVTAAPDGPSDRELVATIVRRLLDEGLAIDRVAPVARSLEERFFTLTTRVEDSR